MELKSNLPEELQGKYEELKNKYFDNFLFDDFSIYENFYYEVVSTDLVAIGYTSQAIKDGKLEVPEVFDYIDFNRNIDADDIIQDGSGVTSINLGRMMLIPGKCFEGWLGLRDIVGNSVLQVGISAFENCISLRTVSFPVLSAVHDFGFKGCNNVLEFIFPNLRVIGEGAFNLCKNVKKMDIHNVRELSVGALAECENLVDLDISGCISLGEESLAMCLSLQSLQLRLCRVFRKGALKGCASLHTLYLDNIMGMEEDSLSMCNNLHIINYYGTKERWEQLIVQSNTEVAVLRKANIMYDFKDIDVSEDTEV